MSETISRHTQATFMGMKITPLTVRRIASFKANRRGYRSFWIFLVLFVFSLFAELIANDKPLLVEYQGSYYFPVLKIYPETAFGGDFQTEAEYREKDVQDLITEKGGKIYWAPYSFQLRHGQSEPQQTRAITSISRKLVRDR